MTGIDNLVDVATDAILVGQDVSAQLKDGFQPLKDIPIIAFNDFGKIQNIVNKGKNLPAELRDLTPDELDEFEARVAKNTGLPATGIAGKARAAVRLVARVYRVVLEVKDIFEDAQELYQAA